MIVVTASSTYYENEAFGVIYMQPIGQHLPLVVRFVIPIMKIIHVTKLEWFIPDNNLNNADTSVIPGLQITAGIFTTQQYKAFSKYGRIDVACLVPAASQTFMTAQKQTLDRMDIR